MAEPTYSPQNKEDIKVLLQKHNGENEEKWPFFRLSAKRRSRAKLAANR
jgi:hypothetical protein